MKFFSLENPVWKFIGNLADFLSCPACGICAACRLSRRGAAASAVYYVTLKMSRDQEGELVRSFFQVLPAEPQARMPSGRGVSGSGGFAGAGHRHLSAAKLGTGGGHVLYQCGTAGLCGAVCHNDLPLLARCDNTPGALFKMGVALTLRNLLPVLSALVVNVAFFAWVSLCSGRYCWWRRGWLLLQCLYLQPHF